MKANTHKHFYPLDEKGIQSWSWKMAWRRSKAHDHWMMPWKMRKHS